MVERVEHLHPELNAQLLISPVPPGCAETGYALPDNLHAELN
jgi:hypothetical protein